MTTKTKDIFSTYTHLHKHLHSNDHLPLCESNKGRVRRRGVAPCLAAHGLSYWTTFVHVHNTRTESHTCHYSGWRFQSWAEPHFRFRVLGSWLQVILSASLSLYLCLIIVFPLSHGGVDFSFFGILRTQNHDLGYYWDCECAVFDLPSFDVVQEGHFNIHQKGKKCYLKVISVFK